MTKKKTEVTEEQIIAVLKDPKYTNEAQRARALGLTPHGQLNQRFRELRKKYEIPEPVRSRPGRQPSKKDEVGCDIQLYDTLTKDGVWYRIIGIDEDGFAIRRTDNIGKTIVVSKIDYLQGKTGFRKRDLPPVKSYVDPALKAGDVKVFGQPIKHLPDNLKEKIVVELKKSDSESVGKGGPRLDDIPQPGSGGEGGPEKPHFEEIDYTDPAWGVTEELKVISELKGDDLSLLIDSLQTRIKKIADNDLSALENIRRRYA